MVDLSNAGISAAIFGGIPVVINPHIPANEVWVIKQGEKQTIHIHEGPQAGQTVEVWLTKPEICRIVNLGDSVDRVKVPLPREFRLEPFEPKIGDWPWTDEIKK